MPSQKKNTKRYYPKIKKKKNLYTSYISSREINSRLYVELTFLTFAKINLLIISPEPVTWFNHCGFGCMSLIEMLMTVISIIVPGTVLSPLQVLYHFLLTLTL